MSSTYRISSASSLHGLLASKAGEFFISSLNYEQQILKPVEEEFRASATQEGDRSTFIANNGLEKIAAVVKKGHLDSSQKGNEVYFNANNADGGNEEATMQKHKECIAILKERPDPQKENGGHVLGGGVIALSEVRDRRAVMFDKVQIK
ncbi:hypothetical protein PMIN06_003298 [Paraphaeosphaeria minitans]